MFNSRNHPIILAHFPIFDRFQKSKKNSQTQARMAVYFVFRCYLKQRFSTRNYFLGFLIFACAAAKRAMGTR